jgi:hypothetical protein
MTRFLPARIFSVSAYSYGCRVVCLGLRCYAHSLFFSMGHIFFYFYYYYYIFFFENHGLGLGTALFRLGTRVSPAMQKNFNLPWKFFQMVGENWGLKLVKPPLSGQTWFGNSSKRSGKNWDLTLSQIAIGWSDPVLEIHPNDRGQIEI